MRAVALVLGAALVAAGCGGSKPSDKDQIETAVTTYYRAFGSGDSATACEELAKDTREELEKAAGGKACEKVLDRALKRPDYARVATKLDGARVTTVKIDGNKATARTEIPGIPAAGGRGVATTVPLEKEGPAWKIASTVGE